VLRRSQILIEAGEYDTALKSIRRLERRLDLGVRREMQWDAQVQKGQIQLRRGRIAAAVSTWQACAERQGTNRIGAAAVRDVMVSHLGFSPRWRPLVIEICDGTITAMKAGALPPDGRLRSIRPLTYYENARKALADWRDAPFPPFFVRHAEGPRDRSDEIRRQLVASEYAQEVSGVLDSFDLLIAHFYSEGRVERMLECALAQHTVARRAGNEDRLFRASANLAASRYWTGDRPKAGPAYARLYAHRLAKRKARYWAGLGRRLPVALWDQLAPRRAVAPHLSMRTRRFTLDEFDALEKRRTRPATLRQLADLARDALEAREFGIARVYVFELASASHAIGDREHEAAAFEMLAESAAVEGRYEQAEALRRRAARVT
jgi:hypothetical protein